MTSTVSNFLHGEGVEHGFPIVFGPIRSGGRFIGLFNGASRVRHHHIAK
jgi:hypothetical protein